VLFVISGTDAPNSLAKRQSVRAEHLARVRELLAAGRLVIAGPHPAIASTEPGPSGYTGSLIVAEFPSQDEAESWASADPYLASGAWSRVEVKPFIQVLP
jgi:uncharacterized protein